MEAFQLLSRGGIKFDKNRFNKDLQLFDGTSKKSQVKWETVTDVSQDSALPAELDFFKYAQGGAPGKRKADGKMKGSPGKRRRLEKDGDFWGEQR
ncbi:hypothetical protein MPER_12529 [Moniliophthora perniciosa FA553]|nr:hypothetical protein MPER_12529 [Moniliophthora perniciosa FA553]